jgi:hypothetical protein
VLRIFGSDTDEVSGDWTILSTEFRNVYYSLNIIRLISKKMRLKGHTRRMRETTVNTKSESETLKHGDRGVDGK